MKRPSQDFIETLRWLVKDATAYVGGLSKPSKMPGRGYGLSAYDCNVGGRLRIVKDSVCSHCYALKGRYVFPNVREAHARRMASLRKPGWVSAMAFLVNRYEGDGGWFRWHDSGDLQGVWHLRLITSVCRATPGTHHWLPTREVAVVREYLASGGEIPDNLTIRVSACRIGGSAPRWWPTTSTVSSNIGSTCPAPKQGGECASCRACWDKSVANVDYKQH